MFSFSMRSMKWVALAALLAFSQFAAAQATRTWVSGVGDDANPCSRTAPCKTFAGAISKTAPAGEINVLDPGGFGAVTITKSITIAAEGVIAGVLVSGTNGIIVNTTLDTDVVVLRGLDIQGLGTGLNGIRFLKGKALYVENCVIQQFTQKGIDAESSTSGSQLFVKNTLIRENMNPTTGGGIFVKPAGGVPGKLVVENVMLERNQFGIRIEDHVVASVRNSRAAESQGSGFVALNAGADMFIESTVASDNAAAAINSQSTARITLSNVVVSNNNIGLFSGGGSGQIVSYGNNRNIGNVTDGSPTITIMQQ